MCYVCCKKVQIDQNPQRTWLSLTDFSQAKELIAGPKSKRVMIKISRLKLIANALTGQCLRLNLHGMSLSNSFLCSGWGEVEESSKHFLCVNVLLLPSLKRMSTLGDFFLTSERIAHIANFSAGSGRLSEHQLVCSKICIIGG